jgi:ubiquinone/menaquinone biosynthesis C-methylase UbiE
MKLNWIERLYVNSPLRLAAQYLEVQWFTKRRPIDAGGIILEIGCGRGAGAGFIFEEFKPSRLYLSDLDPEMVKKARAYLDYKKQINTFFCQTDATDLPFGKQRFDAVFGFGFLHHVPQWRSSLAEVVRVLKTGGAYYLVEFYPKLYQNFITKHILVHPEFDRFKSEDLKDAFRQLRLRLAHCFELKNMGIIGIGIKR